MEEVIRGFNSRSNGNRGRTLYERGLAEGKARAAEQLETLISGGEEGESPPEQAELATLLDMLNAVFSWIKITKAGG